MLFRLICDELSVSMNVRVCGYASLCVSPVMDWTPVQGTTRGANSACVGPLSQAPTLNKQLRNKCSLYGFPRVGFCMQQWICETIFY